MILILPLDKAAEPKITRTVDMTEGGKLVVRHIFYGDTEAEAMEDAHRGADASLDAALKGKKYQGVDIKAERD